LFIFKLLLLQISSKAAFYRRRLQTETRLVKHSRVAKLLVFKQLR